MHYNLIKSRNRRYLEELKDRGHEMPIVYDAVNIIQHTEWVINKPVFDVFEHFLKHNISLGKLPVNPETIEFPPKPVDIATNVEARLAWKKLAKPIHKLQKTQGSKFLQVHAIKTIAKIYIDLDKSFFFPQQMDFRVRIYPVPSMLNPQGADYARALLRFKWGKKMGSNENFDYFAVNGANLYGVVDKEDLETRRQWVIDNSEQILSTATNPLEDTWWSKADKPFCFLAWAMEYKAFADSEFDAEFITTLPIQADCSNSGLQHYSAMMRDEVGGKATNLIPADKPNDVYREVADKVVEKLKLFDKDIGEYLSRYEGKKKLEVDANCPKLWLHYGVDRKLCKKPVMCLPYGLKRYSSRRYIEDHVLRELQERNTPHPFGDDLFKASQFLNRIVWESIGEVVVGAREVMKFLQDVSSLVSSENLPITWTTPLNFPIMMLNYEMESKRVKTKMGDQIVKLTIQSETDKISRKKSRQSVAPNWIHSLDASCLQLAVTKARAAGIDSFSMIHDSFGVLAPDYKIMAECIRDAFCEIYKEDVLKKWADEMYAMLSPKNQRKFPPLPKKGNLDLDLVKNSVFFCI